MKSCEEGERAGCGREGRRSGKEGSKEIKLGKEIGIEREDAQREREDEEH